MSKFWDKIWGSVIPESLKSAFEDQEIDPDSPAGKMIRRKQSRQRLLKMERFLADQRDKAETDPSADPKEKREISQAYGLVVTGLHTHYE